VQLDGDTSQIGPRLKAWRADRDWSGPEAAGMVADHSGKAFEWATLREIEAGEATPEGWVTEALAAVFEKTVDDLIAPPSSAEQAAAASLDLPDHRDEVLRLRSPYRPHVVGEGVEPWELAPGGLIRREELHDRFGGPRKSAISVSKDTPNIFIFTDPLDGRTRGHLDRWIEDGAVYLFGGEGLKGDQSFLRGNKAVLQHAEDGRALRLFEGMKGTVVYAGEFRLADEPYELSQGHEVGGPLRQIILFRMARVT
jgi:hypothetical protein